MNNQKSKNKLNFLLIPFLIFNPLFLLSYSSEFDSFNGNDNEKESLMDEVKDLNLVKDENVNNKAKKQELIQKEQIDLGGEKIDLIFIKNNQIEANNFEESIQNKKDLNIISKQKDQSNEKSNHEFMNESSSFSKGGDIYTGQFEIPLRGYVRLKEQKISLNLLDSDPIVALKLIAKLGNYGIVVVDNDEKEEESSKNNKSLITVNFEETDISDVFNSILMASNLQAK